MRLRVWLLTALAVAAARPAFAQAPGRPADLMPPKTLACVEVRQPGGIVKEINDLFRGSVLGNVPDSLGPLRQKYGSASLGRGPDEMALASLIFAPEIAAELGRIPGLAVAITGIDKETKGMPEFIAVILPGDSNLVRLLMRAFITGFGHGSASFGGQTRFEATAAFEPVGEVDGVKLYRIKERRRTFVEGTAPPKEEVREIGPVLAMTPEALIVGSSQLVKDAIGRIKGKGGGPALSGTPEYKQASEPLGEGPGIFAFGDVKSVLATVEQLPLGREEREVFEAVKRFVNPAAFATVSQAVALQDGTFRYRWQARLDPKEKSPVLELLPPSGLKAELLNFVPQDATVVAGLANSAGGERLQRLLTLADDIFKAAGGDGQAPSEEFAQLERMIGLSINKEIVSRIDGVAVAVAGPNWFRGLVPPAVVIVQATDENAAKALAEETVPRLVSLATQQPDVKPQERQVQGKPLQFVPLFGFVGLCYGREGNTLVFGGYPELVADVLTNGTKKKGLLADQRIAARIKANETIAFVAVKPLTLAAATLPMAAPMLAGGGLGIKPPAGAPGMGILNKVQKDVQELAKHDEPFVVAVSRTADRLTAEVILGGLKQTVPRATDFAVEMYYQMEAQQGSRQPPVFKAVPPSKAPAAPIKPTNVKP